ncbi:MULTISPECIES: hypothetical protein [Paenibacillus]|uniref:hypothetical protein n=1 Tax=Paenibacillus TaxID=44249 RepID=UPI00083991D5|nr:hypothetical protein [Paenibacillus kribbensis]
MSDSYKVISDLYNILFVKPTSDIDLLVDYKIWNRIKQNLPDSYFVPDQTTLYFLNNYLNH